ncbi:MULTISPECIES: 2-dehydropantoate 2-reductase [Dyella]|uniref:2-dehydropantoate 2-reductase n=2 Tax=Dyella TaxID=231454 RepID=A0A4R0YVC7_9GAMM|nr:MULTISPECIES: 2-dehydropantoate 2-reductase [Dyella]TBR39998.1 2-dehydropantoate 2-reductase [Dyella terrae]TCI12421.1 2-dehydropantoate 2-reductase [Dyella soli]
MRILVVGAGATGGYFGGRLLEAGRDVTFLVRPGRARQIAEHGLQIRSPAGDASFPSPPLVQASQIDGPYDLILLSCKAYHLPQVMEDIAPAVGPQTVILPVLNGMRHLDLLDARFGAERVLGGQCIIAATVDAQGIVRHLNTNHSITFGERDGSRTQRSERIADALSDATFDLRHSANIVQDMWDKWVFLASLAAITCLMRAPVGNIMAAPGGLDATLGMLDNAYAVASANGHAPSEVVMERAKGVLTEQGSSLSASMMRDLEQGSPVEADHVVGDMIARGKDAGDLTMLRLAFAHLKAYEARRAA